MYTQKPPRVLSTLRGRDRAIGGSAMSSSIPSTSGIYKITCITTGKMYVGSAVNLRQRWQNHRWRLRTNRHVNRHLQSAWNKHGEDAFAFEVIELILAPFLIEREQYYLDKLRPFDRGRGFNSYPTAGSPYGHVASDEARRRMSEARKGQKSSEARRAHLREIRCRRYVVISPDGAEFTISNMVEFCRANNLVHDKMYKVASGRKGSHRGWWCRRA